jgi:DNA processing protein
MDATDAWLIFGASGLSVKRQQALLAAFGEPLVALGAQEPDLLAIEGWTAAHVGKLRAAEREVDLADLRGRMMYYEISLLPCTDAAYPRLLKEAPDHPPLLYVQGEITRRDDMAVAIVGTRNCTPYGLQVARRLAKDLARRGISVVSGMALGVDGAAHEGALEGEGRTVAVMASGADITYPAVHKDLRTRCAASGAVVTEYGFGTEPLREQFPARNRIIAGLALGTLVVEAPAKSGALITAGLAGEYGREVFAVPGSIDSPNSRGCHELLKDGCRLVEVVEDITEGLGMMLEGAAAEKPRVAPVVSGDEQRLLEALTFQPRHVDEIVAETSLASAQVSSSLMLLEIKGLVRRYPGNRYVRT